MRILFGFVYFILFVANPLTVIGAPAGEKTVDVSNSGTLSYVYKFSLPSARGRYQPSLGLMYSSDGGSSPYGLGFSLSQMYIERVLTASPVGGSGNPRIQFRLVSPLATTVILPVKDGHYRAMYEQTYFDLQLSGPVLTGEEFRPAPIGNANTNLQGSDKAPGFDVFEGDPGICEAACANDPSCLAFTYGSLPSETPRCYLKNGVPKSSADPNFYSGIKDSALLQSFEAQDFDRTGSDIPPVIDIPAGVSRADALKKCKEECLGNPDCRGYAFLPSSGNSIHQCWLKKTPLPPQTWKPQFVSGERPAAWDGYDGQGTHYRFERMVDVRGEQCKSACVRWYLSSVEEVDGNLTKYEYHAEGSSASLVLDGILYNNYDPTQSGKVGDTGHFASIVELRYVPDNGPPYAQTVSGSLVSYRERLDRITIQRPVDSQPNKMIGGYQLQYDASPDTTRTLLRSIKLLGRDGVSAPTSTTFGYTQLVGPPPHNEPYQGFNDAVSMPIIQGSIQGTAEQCQIWFNINSPCQAFQKAAWLDMDGDHRPDLVWGGALRGVYWARNISKPSDGNLSFDPAKVIPGSEKFIGIISVDRRDGAISESWRQKLLQGQNPWGNDPDVPTDPLPRVLVTRVQDVNADGRLDLITVLPDGQALSFNLAMGEGANLSFGPNPSPFVNPLLLKDWKYNSENAFGISVETNEGIIGDLLDLTGDGIVDYVIAKKDKSEWSVYPGFLQSGAPHFGGLFFTFSVTKPNTLHHAPLRKEDSLALADMNGDGLVDRVVVTTTPSQGATWSVAYNTGFSFAVADATFGPWASGDTMIGPLSAQAGSWRFRTGNGLSLLADMNADGLPDYVFKSGQANASFVVSYNTGSGFRRDGKVTYAEPKTGSTAVSLYPVARNGLMADLNKDGIIDYVLMGTSGSWQYFKGGTRAIPLLRPDLLNAIVAPNLLMTSVIYGMSTNGDVDGAPAPYAVVTDVTSNSPFASLRQEQFSYGNYVINPSLLDPAKRDQLGFEMMTITDQQSATVTTTRYSKVFAGIPVESTVMSAPNGTKLATRQLTVVAKSLVGGTCLSSPASSDLPAILFTSGTQATQFEGDATFTSSMTIQCADIDSFGNILSAKSDPDVPTNGDETITSTKFDTSQTALCKACPVQQTIAAASAQSTPLRQSTIFYRQDDAVLPWGQVGKGHVAYRETSFDGTGKTLHSAETFYNPNGMVRQVIAADPKSATIMEYDALQLRVTRLTQKDLTATPPVVLITETASDPDFGQPALVTGPYRSEDPQLASIQAYAYDAFGRMLVKARQPIQNGHVNEPIIAYHYTDPTDTRSPRSVESYTFLANVPFEISARLPDSEDVMFQTDIYDGLGRLIQTRHRLGTGVASTSQNHIVQHPIGYLVTGATLFNDKGLIESVLDSFYSPFPFEDYHDLAVRDRALKTVSGTNLIYDEHDRVTCKLYQNQHKAFDPQAARNDCFSHLDSDANYKLATSLSYSVKDLNGVRYRVTSTTAPEQNVRGSSSSSLPLPTGVTYQSPLSGLVEDAYQNRTAITRDVLGQVVQQQRMIGDGTGGGATITISTKYDVAGRVQSIKDTSSGERFYSYYDAGPVKRIGQRPTPQAPLGADGIEYVIDGFGRQIQVRYTGSTPSVRYLSYDCPYDFGSKDVVCDPAKRTSTNPYSVGTHRLSAVRSDTTTIAFGYRSDGALLLRDQMFTSSGSKLYRVSQEVGYAGNVLSRTTTLPDTAAVSYSAFYDSYLRPVRLERTAQGLSEAVWEAQNPDATSHYGAYDQLGRLLRTQQDNSNIQTDRFYDPTTGYMQSVVATAVKSPFPNSVSGVVNGLTGINYRGTLMTHYDEQPSGISHTFLYDRDQRLVGASLSKGTTTLSQEQFSYFTDKGFDTSVPKAPSLWNLEHSRKTTSGGADVDQVYKYGSSDSASPDAVGDIATSNGAQTGDTSMSYKPTPELGLLQAIGKDLTLQYNVAGQLVEMSALSMSDSLFYDGTGGLSEREIKTGNTSVRIYYVGPHATVTTGPADSVEAGVHVLLGNTRLLTIPTKVGGTPFYYYRDWNGSVLTTLATGARPGTSYTYSAYGERTVAMATPGTASELGFIGARMLTSGLLHFNARVYSANLRRFLQPDTVDPLRYTYSAGDPINKRDPSGLGWQWTIPRGPWGGGSPPVFVPPSRGPVIPRSSSPPARGWAEMWFRYHEKVSPDEWSWLGPSAMIAKVAWMEEGKIERARASSGLGPGLLKEFWDPDVLVARYKAQYGSIQQKLEAVGIGSPSKGSSSSGSRCTGQVEKHTKEIYLAAADAPMINDADPPTNQSSNIRPTLVADGEGSCSLNQPVTTYDFSDSPELVEVPVSNADFSDEPMDVIGTMRLSPPEWSWHGFGASVVGGSAAGAALALDLVPFTEGGSLLLIPWGGITGGGGYTAQYLGRLWVYSTQ